MNISVIIFVIMLLLFVGSRSLFHFVIMFEIVYLCFFILLVDSLNYEIAIIYIILSIIETAVFIIFIVLEFKNRRR